MASSQVRTPLRVVILAPPYVELPPARYGGTEAVCAGLADALLERSETRQLVRDAIDRLPESYRTVLVLRDIEQVGTEETARLLGLTRNALRYRLSQMGVEDNES